MLEPEQLLEEDNIRLKDYFAYSYFKHLKIKEIKKLEGECLVPFDNQSAKYRKAKRFFKWVLDMKEKDMDLKI